MMIMIIPQSLLFVGTLDVISMAETLFVILRDSLLISSLQFLVTRKNFRSFLIMYMICDYIEYHTVFGQVYSSF